MDLATILITILLLAPPVVIGWFWRASRRPLIRRRPGSLPDSAALVFVRLGAVICGCLPTVQMLLWIVRYHLGEAGIYLWYILPGLGVLLVLFVLAGYLAYARGSERTVSSAMLVLSVAMLLLLMFLGSPFAE